jgi:hypothetical protein
MRNIFAHHQYKESFKDKEVIEVLSDDYILNKDSEGDLQILSNLI